MISIPLPNEIKKYDKYSISILSSAIFKETLTFPQFSLQEKVEIKINATIGNVNVLLLDEEALNLYIQEKNYDSIFEIQNSSNFDELIEIDQPCSQVHLIIETNQSSATFALTLEIICLTRYVSWGAVILIIGLGMLFYWLNRRSKLKPRT
jgi:hypothetical protein